MTKKWKWKKWPIKNWEMRISKSTNYRPTPHPHTLLATRNENVAQILAPELNPCTGRSKVHDATQTISLLIFTVRSEAFKVISPGPCNTA
jgi:hypothetical protein